jgi:dihydroflavonol-4-reductase
MVGPDDGPVVVTGATGLVGSAVVAELLQRGYTVRAPVRDPDRTRREGYLSRLPGAERLMLSRGDLVESGSYDEVMVGAAGVVHVASPYILSVKDPHRELVVPALEGTKHVLASAARAGTVRRFVLTSSTVAISDRPKDHPLTEEDWNQDSTLGFNSYPYSKTLAERAAWTFVEEKAPSFGLVVVNPSGVIGPSLSPSLSETCRQFVNWLTFRTPAIIAMQFAYVDVREVAVAHAEVLARPQARGRYIVNEGVHSMAEVRAAIAGTGRRVSPINLDSSWGVALTRPAMWLQNKGTRDWVLVHLGKQLVYGPGRARTELGIEYRPFEESVSEMLVDLARWGHIRA